MLIRHKLFLTLDIGDHPMIRGQPGLSIEIDLPYLAYPGLGIFLPDPTDESVQHLLMRVKDVSWEHGEQRASCICEPLHPHDPAFNLNTRGQLYDTLKWLRSIGFTSGIPELLDTIIDAVYRPVQDNSP